MRLLLDTHALLWWAGGNTRLPARARSAIGDARNLVLVSAASAWEISTKVRLGKLLAPEALHDRLLDYLTEQEFGGLEVSIRHGQRAGALPDWHRDPFDRMLVAQAQIENLTLVSNESVFDSYGVQRPRARIS